MRDWTRRRFLVTTLAGTAGASGIARAAGASGAASGAASSAWPDTTRAALLAAMDAIVPAEGAMPAAGEAGVLLYLERVATRDPDARRQLRRAASSLDRRARPARFASLSPERRVQLLAELEAKEPPVFEALRDFVYEGYYTRPEIWKRMGFEFTPPDRPGPGLPAFDETAVERVKARPPSYRKVT